MKKPNARVWKHFKEMDLEKRVLGPLKNRIKKLNPDTASVLGGVFIHEKYSANMFLRTFYSNLSIPKTSVEEAFARACSATLGKPVLVVPRQFHADDVFPGHPPKSDLRGNRQARRHAR